MVGMMTINKTIVLVEDDIKLAKLIKNYLEQNGFIVEHISNGFDATDMIIKNQPDLVILDLMLPGMDGISICKSIKNHYQGIVMFLTASEDEIDHVVCLEIGGDDFLSKPIRPRVLLAHIHMLFRREQKERPEQHEKQHSETKSYQFGDLVINSSSREVSINNKKIEFTTGEFDLLWLLASHSDKALSRHYLYKTLRGIDYDGLDRGMDTKVGVIRKKLAVCDEASQRIKTLRGQGYTFSSQS